MKLKNPHENDWFLPDIVLEALDRKAINQVLKEDHWFKNGFSVKKVENGEATFEDDGYSNLDVTIATPDGKELIIEVRVNFKKMWGLHQPGWVYDSKQVDRVLKSMWGSIFEEPSHQGHGHQ